MSYEVTRAAIASYIASNWDNTYPVFSENQGEQQPTGVFGRYSIRPINAASVDVGGTLGRVNGLLWFQIFCLEGQGTSNAMKFADKVKGLFDEAWLTTSNGKIIKFRRTELSYVGVEPSGRPMWRATVAYHVDA